MRAAFGDAGSPAGPDTPDQGQARLSKRQAKGGETNAPIGPRAFMAADSSA